MTKPQPSSEPERDAATVPQVAPPPSPSTSHFRPLLDVDQPLSELVSQLPVGIYACDTDGRLMYYNQRAAELWGATPLLGTPESEIYASRPLRRADGSEVVADETPIHLATTTGQRLRKQEMWLGDDANARIVLLDAEPAYDETGELTGAVGVMQDVTDIRQASQLRDQLLSLFSHELRTPLTIINGMAGFLAHHGDAVNDRRRLEAVMDIVAAGKRMVRVVDNMLMLSHIDHDHADLEPVLVRQAVNEAVDRHREDFPRSLVSVAPIDPSLIVNAVPEWSRLILVNLLHNAHLYGEPGSPLTLKAHAKDGAVRIIVCNKGAVLPDADYEELFRAFYRRPETSDAVPGAGLGLTVSRRLAEAQGGTLEGRALRDGSGSQFALELIAARPHEVA